MSEYSDCLDRMYNLAVEQGKAEPDTAWLHIDEIWWPNPHYTGEPVGNPDCPDNKSQFHPPITRNRSPQ